MKKVKRVITRKDWMISIGMFLLGGLAGGLFGAIMILGFYLFRGVFL